MGIQIQWISAGSIKLFKTGLTIEMKLNDKAVMLNGRPMSINAPAVLKDSALFLPVRPLASMLGLGLAWNSANAAIALTSGASSASPDEPPFRIVAYYPSWAAYQGIKASQFAGSEITHLNYAFASIADGKIALSDPQTDRSAFNELARLKEATPELRTLISIGGWYDSGSFSDIALTNASRIRFADSVVRFIRDYGFDGADLDWEYPVSGGLPANSARPEDKHNFTLLLQALRSKLDAAQAQDKQTYLLTIASAAFSGYIRNTEMDKVGAIVDWVNLMTYDYSGSWDGRSNHLAPLYPDSGSSVSSVSRTVSLYRQAGVPARKLVVGIPFYGRGWDGCAATANGFDQLCQGASRGAVGSGVHGYSELENSGWINGNGFVRYWSDTAKAPWLYRRSTGTFITYEDPESIAYKAGYIKSQGLGGAMVWDLSQDTNGTLLNKLSAQLRNGK
jgi:chitinase